MHIELLDVTMRFGDRKALGPVSLHIPGTGLTIVGGPNGAGKSVLLKLLAGILRPTSGRLLWDGSPVHAHLSAYKFRIGYMPQAPGFYEDQSVSASLRYFARLKAIPTALVEARVLQILQIVHLSDLAKRRVRRLSGGERTRLALGVALLNDPDLLLLDEPGANLDPSERRELWDLIGQMKTGRSVVMATHVFAGLEGVADRLVVLDEGDVLCDAWVDRMLERVGREVWEIVTPAVAKPEWREGVHVVWRRRSEDSMLWHVLAPGVPAHGAQPAAATLDDVYLWLRWRAKGKGGRLQGQEGTLSSSTLS